MAGNYERSSLCYGHFMDPSGTWSPPSAWGRLQEGIECSSATGEDCTPPRLSEDRVGVPSCARELRPRSGFFPRACVPLLDIVVATHEFNREGLKEVRSRGAFAAARGACRQV